MYDGSVLSSGVSPPSSYTASQVVAEGHKHGVNFRKYGDKLTLACDETTTVEDIEKAWAAFAMGKPVPFNAMELASSVVLPKLQPSLQVGRRSLCLSRLPQKQSCAFLPLVAAHGNFPNSSHVQHLPFRAPDAKIHMHCK